MITRILINNSPAFKLLELHLFKGFNVFSGASGSGKSVFMESLLAMFGIKDSNADLIEINLSLEALDIDLADYGILEEDSQIVLSILKKEKVRYFINHQSSSKKRLSELVAGFGKHISARGESDVSAQNILKILDSFIALKNPKHNEILESVKSDFDALESAKKSLLALESNQSQIETLKEIARFEVEKITSIAPKVGELDELLELKKTLSKQEKITDSIQQVRMVLENLSCVDSFLQASECECEAFFDGLSELEALLDSKQQQLQSLEELDAEKILERISALSELTRRYGSIERALEVCKEQQEKLLSYENMDFDKKELESKIASLQTHLQEKSTQLHQNRAKALPQFCKELSGVCEELRLKPLEMHLQEKSLDSSGNDEIMTTLGNSQIQTLSSGEYNRLRLALLCIDVSISPRAGVLVLDEIDANLSGQESEGVAKILKRLSRAYQIFAISHQPHMPTLADNHYLVYKDGEKSEVKLLDTQGRVSEIARMISGAEISKEALEFAKNALAKSGVVDSN